MTPPTAPRRPVFTSNLVNLAHANGLKIFGSNRSWGNDIPGEIGMADYVFTNGADGFIYDAESEWETSSKQPLDYQRPGPGLVAVRHRPEQLAQQVHRA